jgi:hypothetical protein
MVVLNYVNVTSVFVNEGNNSKLNVKLLLAFVFS